MSKSPVKPRADVIKQITKRRRDAAQPHKISKSVYKKLPRGHKRIIDDLEAAVEQMRRFHRFTPDDLERCHEEYKATLDVYERVLARAFRAKLVAHPRVRAEIQARRSLGDWDFLRKARAGWERDVKRPWSKDDLWLACAAQYVIEEWIKQRKAEERHANAEASSLRYDGKKMTIKAIRWQLVDNLKTKAPSPLVDLTKDDIERLLDRLENTTEQNFYKWFARVVG